MGCFLACFGSSKDRKTRKQRHKVQPRFQVGFFYFFISLWDIMDLVHLGIFSYMKLIKFFCREMLVTMLNLQFLWNRATWKGLSVRLRKFGE